MFTKGIQPRGGDASSPSAAITRGFKATKVLNKLFERIAWMERVLQPAAFAISGLVNDRPLEIISLISSVCDFARLGAMLVIANEWHNQAVDDNEGNDAERTRYLWNLVSFRKGSDPRYRNSGSTTKNTMYEISIADQKGLAL